MKKQKKSISLTVANDNVDFVNSLSKNLGKNRSEIIDDILSKYRKFKLKKDIKEGFKNQTQGDLDDAVSDFFDYLELVDKNI